MSYFSDLTRYSYFGAEVQGDVRNVGWLARGHEFNIMNPDEHDLDKLWELCKISVNQTRGIHNCDFCAPDCAIMAERHGAKLLLGTAEIRVLSSIGRIYAAPTLVFHYMSVHNYRPPDEFIDALRNGVMPPAEDYFRRLREIGVEWGATRELYARAQTFRMNELPE